MVAGAKLGFVVNLVAEIGEVVAGAAGGRSHDGGALAPEARGEGAAGGAG
ncbi:hypothetical protein GCM10009802_12800 [Streptomyces synnematoformans]|uniref:Uncharacterized protein n=1 Tax=Streptomyces synnematoformans TaxID=415721 RepID=A0ABN2XLW2_9ACTN